METVYKDYKTIELNEAEKMFEIFLNNMRHYAEKNPLYASILKEEYKEKWIKNIMENANVKDFLYYENGELIAFITIKVSETEQYVNDFHIIPRYQGDGSTFKNMILGALPHLDMSKEFTGDIWMLNNHSRDVFKHLGAKFENDKYRINFENLKKWIDK